MMGCLPRLILSSQLVLIELVFITHTLEKLLLFNRQPADHLIFLVYQVCYELVLFIHKVTDDGVFLRDQDIHLLISLLNQVLDCHILLIN